MGKQINGKNDGKEYEQNKKENESCGQAMPKHEIFCENVWMYEHKSESYETSM